MRVLLTADPYLPVPPTLYGGIERVVALLVRGLAERGHEVTLVAHPESSAPAHRLLPYGAPPHTGAARRAREVAQVGRILVREAPAHDVVHSFGRLAALTPVLPLRGLRKVQSYQRDRVPWRSVRIATALAGESIRFTGCSTSVWSRGGKGPPAGRWATVFNCVDADRWTAVPAVPGDAPLVFLGRLEPVKGVHHAIAAARAAGRRLVIAGNRVEEGGAAGYFDREIAPHLDGDRVRWEGPVDDAAKDRLLGAAAALLAPVEFEEPFGIVMAEAMACGTPVIGFRRGAVPEVVRDGVTGFVVDGAGEAAAAVARLPGIDRRAVRAECEARFHVPVVVSQYVRLYEGSPAPA